MSDDVEKSLEYIGFGNLSHRERFDMVISQSNTIRELRAEVAGNDAENAELLRALELCRTRAEKLRKLDSEAAQYVETVICMRTGFTGEEPYRGWRGLGLALTEALDARDEAELAELRSGKAEQEAATIDLDKESWKAIQEAASESDWIPPQYFQNDWISDVCAFLRGDREC